MNKCYLRAHLDHQALPIAYFFSFEPCIQNAILFSLHSSNKVPYMSDAGVVCGYSRFVIDLTVVWTTYVLGLLETALFTLTLSLLLDG